MRIIAIAAALLVAACTGTPTAEQRAATDLNPSGRPYLGPPGTLASTPPADSSFDALYCHPEGQGASCSRTR